MPREVIRCDYCDEEFDYWSECEEHEYNVHEEPKYPGEGSVPLGPPLTAEDMAKIMAKNRKSMLEAISEPNPLLKALRQAPQSLSKPLPTGQK